MKAIACGILFILNSLMGCTQEKSNNSPLLPKVVKREDPVPFLTKQEDFVFVDKATLQPITNQRFQRASAFTPTGFATVINEEQEYAVIDEKGNMVFDFCPEEISLDVVNGLTLYKKEKEYEKKMPFYKWDWNIMGGGIQKEQNYHKTEIGIVESKQILLQKDAPYLESNFYLNFIDVDGDHIFWNEALYRIKNNKLDKVENNIAELLENKRYLKGSSNRFSLYELGNKKAILNGLIGVDKISILYNNENIVLNDVNKERFAPEVPKLLVDSENKNIYPFPQYDKVFPKEIKKATQSQIDFIRKTSLVYSIHNSPYFLLGVFNYDHDVWAYDWLYIDTAGNVVNELKETYNFEVLDQVGNLVWPDRKMIFPDEWNTEKWKFGKIDAYGSMGDLYIIPVEDQKEIRTKGLWNSRSKIWEIKPEYQDITVLDASEGIYALQKDKDGLYMLYNNKAKQLIGLKGYNSIHSDGLVSIKNASGELTLYFVDIYSGKEYKED